MKATRKVGPRSSARRQEAELAQRLSAVPLFSRCDDRDLRIVARHAEIVMARPDVDLVVEGDDGDALFVVLEGTARVTREGVTRVDLGPGDYFGELALLDPAPRAATVTTIEACTVAVLSVRMFRVLLREVPPLAAELLAHLARQVREAGGILVLTEPTPGNGKDLSWL